jgi:hypothetical protein
MKITIENFVLTIILIVVALTLYNGTVGHALAEILTRAANAK